jgi:hypothetical protein
VQQHCCLGIGRRSRSLDKVPQKLACAVLSSHFFRQLMTTIKGVGTCVWHESAGVRNCVASSRLVYGSKRTLVCSRHQCTLSSCKQFAIKTPVAVWFE